jgi:hypothetical protein
MDPIAGALSRLAWAYAPRTDRERRLLRSFRRATFARINQIEFVEKDGT